jgi:hypothetical protein
MAAEQPAIAYAHPTESMQLAGVPQLAGSLSGFSQMLAGKIAAARGPPPLRAVHRRKRLCSLQVTRLALAADAGCRACTQATVVARPNKAGLENLQAIRMHRACKAPWMQAAWKARKLALSHVGPSAWSHHTSALFTLALQAHRGSREGGAVHAVACCQQPQAIHAAGAAQAARSWLSCWHGNAHRHLADSACTTDVFVISICLYTCWQPVCEPETSPCVPRAARLALPALHSQNKHPAGTSCLLTGEASTHATCFRMTLATQRQDKPLRPLMRVPAARHVAAAVLIQHQGAPMCTALGMQQCTAGP